MSDEYITIITTMSSLKAYLNRDVFERLYNTPTTASRMQRFGSVPPEGWDYQEKSHHILFGTPHCLDPPSSLPKVRTVSLQTTVDSKSTPRKISTPSSRKQTPKKKSPTSVATSPSQFSTQVSSSPVILSPPRKRNPSSKKINLKWEPKKINGKASSSVAASSRNRIPSPKAKHVSKPSSFVAASSRNRIPPPKAKYVSKGSSLPTIGRKKPIPSAPPDALKPGEFATRKRAEKMFQRLDANGKGALTFEDNARGIDELCSALDHKTLALMAYQALDSTESGLMDISEFHFFLNFLTFFNNIWDEFVFFDEDDLRMSKGEYTPVAERLALFDDLKATFEEMDPNGGGFILFDEFCAVCAKRQLELSEIDDTKNNNLECSNDIPAGTGEAGDLPLLEEMLDMSLPLTQEKSRNLFQHLDGDGSGVIFLEKIDSGISEVYPELGSMPLAVQAYKALTSDRNGLLDASEFHYFLLFLAYFNNLWDEFVFFDEDDLRISKSEFTPVAETLGLFDDAEATFEGMDSKGGGFVMFEEFCALCAKIKLELTLTSDAEEKSASEDYVRADNNQAPLDFPDELNEIELPSQEELLRLFDSIDVNGNGKLSLAELDKFIVGQRPECNRKSAMRAYRATDRDDDGFVLRSEFPYFYRFIIYYNKFWDGFAAIDMDDDRRISRDAFALVAKQLDGSVDVDREFAVMDVNGDGFVLFDEFCAFCAKRKLASALMGVSKKAADPPDAHLTLGVNNKACHVVLEETVATENLPDADANVDCLDLSTEKRQSDIPSEEELLGIFDSIDVNGMRMLTHAELSKYILEHRPEWNLKSAITRAYRAADLDGDGFVLRSEFPFFYRLIVSYTKFWDPNRRISKDEFAAVAWKLCVTDVNAVFAELDSNGDGYILMDEFTTFKERRKREMGESEKPRMRRSRSTESLSTVDSGSTLFPMEMHDVGLRDTIQDVLNSVDTDSNGILSLSEFENYIIQRQPKWNCKAAIADALKAVDHPNENSFHRDHVPFILHFVVYYQFFWRKYTTLDGNGDRRITKRQLSRAARHMRISNVDETFAKLDTDGSGHLLFDTVCALCAKQKLQAIGENSWTSSPVKTQ